jgi:transposase
MAQKRLSMRKTAEILRLKHEVGLTNREIARSCGIGRATVANYLARAQQAGLTWPLPDDLDDDELQAVLFADAEETPPPTRPLPDMEQVHKELRRPGVTLQLLWEEYRADHPDGYAYTQFCEYYRRWKAPLQATLRQRHIAGEKTFVDWAGDKAHWVEPDTGEIHDAFLFLAVLGASNYTFARAYPDQQLPHWIEAHVDACASFGGVTRLWVPDNPRTGITRPCYYEPEIHRSYQELADHYGTAILPTRVAAPRDKAKVEGAVLHAERQILARLRDQTFFSLAALNAAIRQHLTALNQRPFQKLSGSRAQLFAELDRPVLGPLPPHPFELGQWRRAKVNIDYHIQVDWHCYSVPYLLIHQEVEVRLSARTVEIYHRGRRVAAHPRSGRRGGFSTDPAHRPKAHQRHLEWSPGRLIAWAGEIGPPCQAAITTLLESKPHPEQGYRACLGIMRLGRDYGRQRLEAACHRARVVGTCSFRSIRSILQAKLDQQPLSPPPRLRPPQSHGNIRGRTYYQSPPPAPGPPSDGSAP